MMFSFLGYFAFGMIKTCSIFETVKRLKHLIIGDHDKVILKSNFDCKYFESIEPLDYVKDG